MPWKERSRKLIHSRHILWGIGAASFLESIIIPIPLETVLIPAMQVRRNRIWALATAALLGCLLGATIGYAVGYFLFEAVGSTLIEWFGSEAQFNEVKNSMNREGFWFVLSVGVAPIPFQIAMLAAGATFYSIPLFLLASGIARSIRYYGLALLVFKYGNKAEALFQKHKLTASLFALAVVGAIWLAKRWVGG